MTEPYREILVVDLLGGIGDLVMLLSVIHGLVERNPRASLRVVTHEPSADLVRGDRSVREVRTAGKGCERQAVADALADRRPDLAVTTTRYAGIPELLEASGARCVTDLWRHPPQDELVSERYLRILRDEGLLDWQGAPPTPRLLLTPAEEAAGERILADHLPSRTGRPPVVLVPDAGMAVKRWPERHWRRLASLLTDRGHTVLAVQPLAFVPVLPPVGLRELAACFAAVARRGGMAVGADTGPVRLAAATGASTVCLFGPTLAVRYGIGAGAADVQGLPACPHRRPTSISEQVCWWHAECPITPGEPACMAGMQPERVAEVIAGLCRRHDRGCRAAR